jgi:threonine aldolase
MRIELRSDTFTLPTAGMREAMREAGVGDDVFGEDPSVNALEEKVAALFGMAAAVYCPTGTMSNQIAIKAHTQPGDELICEKQAHVYIYEGGGVAFNAGCQVHPISGDRGRINAGQIADAINPDDVHKARTALVCLENTSNRGGGSYYALEAIRQIHALCRQQQLGLHLDGARLFNALVATGDSTLDYGGLFDSISICLNKGLGCPIGSVLTGSAQFIKRARRIRKVFGGGMRQAGFMAASGIYAIDHHISRLQTDHDHAQQIAAALRQKDFVQEMMPVDTNLVIFAVSGRYTPAALVEKLVQNDIFCLAISARQVRMVTHLNIEPPMVARLIGIIESL